MKSLRSKFKIVAFLLIVSLAFASCSKEDPKDGLNKKDPNLETNKTNAYSFTFAGGETYANSWSAEEKVEGKMMFSAYVKTEDSYEAISLTLGDQEKDIQIYLDLYLENDQPLPLADISDGVDYDSDFSGISISIGEIDYQSVSGTARLSRLKKNMIAIAMVGQPTYTMEFSGVFSKFDPSVPYLDVEEREKIGITGTFQVGSN